MKNKILAMFVFAVLVAAISGCTSYEYKPYGENMTLLPGDGLLEGNGTEAANETEAPESEADVVALEGELIDLMPFITSLVVDPDGDDVSLGFTLPFDKEGKWQTKEGDAGFYSIIVTATDNKDSFVPKQITVKVLVKNKAPVIEIDEMLAFKEGDLIVLNPKITDEDSPEVFVTYSGWMSSKTYQTTFEDAGMHKVIITADDKKTRVSKEITIIVEDTNRPPVLNYEGGEKISVVEGDLVKIEATASDPDGDKPTVVFSEPLSSSGKWQTEKGDAGVYKITITVSDKMDKVEKELELEVIRKNLPPVIESVTVIPDSVVLKKPGDEVTLRVKVVASDPDGDNLEITYSGFMDTEEKIVKYGEKGGAKTVTVTVSDGMESVSQDVSFEMNNWPCFDCAP